MLSAEIFIQQAKHKILDDLLSMFLNHLREIDAFRKKKKKIWQENICLPAAH